MWGEIILGLGPGQKGKWTLINGKAWQRQLHQDVCARQRKKRGVLGWGVTIKGKMREEPCRKHPIIYTLFIAHFSKKKTCYLASVTFGTHRGRVILHVFCRGSHLYLWHCSKCWEDNIYTLVGFTCCLREFQLLNSESSHYQRWWC